MAETIPLAPRVEDPRLSIEFERRLARYMGTYDHTSLAASRYLEWYRDHSGRRSDWFRQDLLWRLQRHRSLAGLRVLDFGCGTGSSSVVLTEPGAIVVGVETEPISLAVAARRAVDLQVQDRCTFVRIPYITEAGIGLPFATASFDVCTLIGVLEHMTPRERVVCVAEMYRVLKPGGELFVFDTPNRAFPKDLHTTHLWFIGWIPERIAATYAVRRKRVDRRKPFRRLGGNGVSRHALDRLFVPSRWRLSYDKAEEEVRGEFERLGHRWGRIGATLITSVTRLRARPTYWTASHALGFIKI